MFISPTVAARVNEIEKSNKSPWVIVVNDHVIGAEPSRTAARTYNDSLETKGSVSKYDASLIEFDETFVSADVSDPLVAKAVEQITTLAAVVNADVVAPPTVAPPKPKLDVLRVSTIERPTKRVWAIADDMLRANPNTKRSEIIAKCVAEGIAFYTARTQYQQFFETLREQRTREAAAATTAA